MEESALTCRRVHTGAELSKIGITRIRVLVKFQDSSTFTIIVYILNIVKQCFFTERFVLLTEGVYYFKGNLYTMFKLN